MIEIQSKDFEYIKHYQEGNFLIIHGVVGNGTEQTRIKVPPEKVIELAMYLLSHGLLEMQSKIRDRETGWLSPYGAR